MLSRFSFLLPTKVLFGSGCVKDRQTVWILGKKAIIVTGRQSAKASGALDDVTASLEMDYVLFDEVENNPSLETVARGGQLAVEEGCDFIVAIGGGSPLDAAKAIGYWRSTMLNRSAFTIGWDKPALPITAIPTTAELAVR